MKIAMKRISLLVVAVFCCANMIKAEEVIEEKKKLQRNMDRFFTGADRVTNALVPILILAGLKVEESSRIKLWLGAFTALGCNFLINVGAATRAKKERRRRSLLKKITVSGIALGTVFLSSVSGKKSPTWAEKSSFMFFSTVATGWGCYDLYALARYGFSKVK